MSFKWIVKSILNTMDQRRDSVRLEIPIFFAAIEKDFTVMDRNQLGGKVLRDGMGVSATKHVTIHQLLIPITRCNHY